MKLLLRDLQAGQNYKVQVRSNDGQAVSDWSIIYDLTTTVDNVAPNAPTSFVVVQQGTTSIITWVAPTANTDGSLMKDFGHYDVEAYSDGVISVYQTGIERFEFPYEYNVTIFGQYKTNTGFRVRAVDQTGNASAWTTRTFGVDLAPSQPKPPILIKDTTDPVRDRLFVRHDLMKNDNTGRLETDVNRLKIYSTASASSTPTVVGSTLIGTMLVSGSSVFAISGTMTLADWTGKHFFVVAQDIAGNISSTSPTSPVSGATTGLFADVAYISIAYIDYLEANKIKAGTGLIDNITVKSSLIMGAARDGSAPSDADTNAVPITQTVMRSANYAYGTTGWIIRGDGYAEFRNLAANSINIGKFDQVTQSVVSTKFSDYMEDSTLWGRHTTNGIEETDGGTVYDAGTFTGLLNQTGAYSSRAILQLAGNASVRRKSAGLQRGIAFEPGSVYKITGRLRQVVGPATNAINNPTFRLDTVNANTGDTASDGVANYWREYASITATKTLQSGLTGPVTEITTAQRASGSIGAGGYVGFRGNTPLFNSGAPNQNALPVVVGRTYTLSAYFKASAIPGTGTAAVAIEWYNAAGALLSTSTEGTQVITTGTWFRVVVSAVAPASAAVATPRLRIIGSSAGTLTADFTGVMFTQTAAAITYFDGSTTYHAWSGTAQASPSYETHTTKYRVGVLGFDQAGNLCAADGSTSADPALHYMVAADGTTQLATFDGAQTESAGWTEVIGYIKDRSESGIAPGAHNDPYLPGQVHKNVRFIVPFIEMNINDNPVATTFIGETDMFAVETTNSNAPVVLKTGTSKGITIQDLQGDSWSHAIRLYSGNDDEAYPGLITEIQDADFNQSHTMVIAPPQTVPGDRASLNDGIRIRGRNANLLSNPSFESAYTAAATQADFENIKFCIGFGNASRQLDLVNYHQGWGTQSIKITATSNPSNVFFYHHLMAYNFPELLGQTKVTASAWVRNDPANSGALNAGFFVNAFDSANVLISAIPGTNAVSTTMSVPNDGAWYRITQTFDFSSPLPNGFPDNTNYWNVGFGFNSTATGQIFNFDDIQLEIGSAATGYKPQTPTSYYFPGGGMIIGNTLVISDRISSFNDMTNSRWAPTLDYEAANPSVQLENEGMTGILEKWSGLNILTSVNESYLALRVIDDQGVIQGPWVQIKDSNDEGSPNTIQYLNQQRGLMGYWGSMADPTNPEANSTARDLIVYGAFRADGAPNWTTGSIGTNLSHTGGAYPFSTFNSNGVTYLRGSIANVSVSNSGATIIAIPAAHRPSVTAYITVSVTNGSGAGVLPKMYVMQITSAGAGTIRNGTNTVLVPGEIMFFDGTFFSTSGSSTVAGSGGENPATIGTATQPSSFAIAPYASGWGTGVYRLTWTNANDTDNAKLRIVWRVDRTPTSATDGTILNVTTVNNAAQSYLLAGLPVGKRIYIKAYAVNKNGVINSTSPPAADRFLLASPIVVTANSSASYRDGNGGMWRSDGDFVMQGQWTENDNHRGLFFYGTQISDKLNTGGVARTPTRMTLYMQRNNTGGIYGGATIDLWPTALDVKPSGLPAIITAQTAGNNIVAIQANSAASVTIPSEWYPAYTAGTYKGFAIYTTDGSSKTILYGRSTGPEQGKINIYHKG